MDVGYDLKVTLIEQQQFVGYKFKKFLLVNVSCVRLSVCMYVCML